MNNCDDGRDLVLRFAAETYGTRPEYLWKRSPRYAVLRHQDNQKWYGLIMNVMPETIGLSGAEEIDILNLKCDPQAVGFLRSQKGILPAYHMNKEKWITVLLDGSIAMENVYSLLEMSFYITASHTTLKKKKMIPNQAWLVPANPFYYDVEQDFGASGTILWKQNRTMLQGDTVYLYMAAPVSAILYQCRVEETDILEKTDSNGTLRRNMRLKLVRRFPKELMPLSRMKKLGVSAVRSARHVPPELKEELDKLDGEYPEKH